MHTLAMQIRKKKTLKKNLNFISILTTTTTTTTTTAIARK
jgi:hypothetical protein